MIISPRRKARQLALQILYEMEASHHNYSDILKQHQEDINISEAILSFAEELIKGVLANKPRLEQLIKKHAPSYPVDQLAPVDRNILKLAIHEILFDNRVPKKAVINEAIELAKKYGSEGTPRFINGVLGSVMRTEVEGEKAITS